MRAFAFAMRSPITKLDGETPNAIVKHLPKCPTLILA